jgi:hypothetical protein
MKTLNEKMQDIFAKYNELYDKKQISPLDNVYIKALLSDDKAEAFKVYNEVNSYYEDYTEVKFFMSIGWSIISNKNHKDNLDILINGKLIPYLRFLRIQAEFDGKNYHEGDKALMNYAIKCMNTGNELALESVLIATICFYKDMRFVKYLRLCFPQDNKDYDALQKLIEKTKEDFWTSEISNCVELTDADDI